MGNRPASSFQSAINFSNSGDNTVLPAVANFQLRIYGILFTVSGATNITFKSDANAMSGAIVFTGNGSSMTLLLAEEPYFSCNIGEAFIMNSSNAVQVSGILYYVAS